VGRHCHPWGFFPIGVPIFDNGEYITGTVSFRKDFDGDGLDDLQGISFEPSRVFTDAVVGCHGEDSSKTLYIQGKKIKNDVWKTHALSRFSDSAQNQLLSVHS
jgi:hypothetical protein